MDVITLLTTYFAAMNIIGLFLMGLDKHKAKKHLWRIPESTLFITAIIGGSIGCIIGMYAFRHKTRRWYFVYGMPVILLLQIALLVAILHAPFQIQIMQHFVNQAENIHPIHRAGAHTAKQLAVLPSPCAF